MALLSGVSNIIFPVSPTSELAVMSLKDVSLGCSFRPKTPWDLMVTLPPRPWVALAVISLFSLGMATMKRALISMLPPLPGDWELSVPAVAEI